MPESSPDAVFPIRFHLDSPAVGESLDASELTIRGWVIAETTVPVRGLEVWRAGEMIGNTEEFHSRRDVIDAFGLPAESRNGFELRIVASQGSPLELRLRLSDGSGSAFTTIDLTAFGHHPTPLGTLLRNLRADALGLEIGAHVNPVRGLTPFYTDAVANFAGSAGTTDFLSHATALPLPDAVLDYLCASHVIEHLPNPIAALFEWQRVIKPGGYLYLVIPDQRFTFDRGRRTTDVRHLLEDFRLQATANRRVVAHVDEFVFETDWSVLRPRSRREDEKAERNAAKAAYLDQIGRNQYIDIHYHTFTPESVRWLFQAIGFAGTRRSTFHVLACAEKYPADRGDGIGVLLQKTTTGATVRVSSTYCLSHAKPGLPPLPLVSPATLDGLSMREANGSGALVNDRGERYPFVHGIPDLVASPGAVVSRKWNRRVERERVYWCGVVRSHIPNLSFKT